MTVGCMEGLGVGLQRLPGAVELVLACASSRYNQVVSSLALSSYSRGSGSKVASSTPSRASNGVWGLWPQPGAGAEPLRCYDANFDKSVLVGRQAGKGLGLVALSALAPRSGSAATATGAASAATPTAAAHHALRHLRP